MEEYDHQFEINILCNFYEKGAYVSNQKIERDYEYVLTLSLNHYNIPQLDKLLQELSYLI